VNSDDRPDSISVNRYQIYSDLYAELKQMRRY